MYDIAILCGGLAKRLGKITTNTPKSLIDINGKPFIYHQLKLLEKNNFSHVVLCVGHLGEKVQQYVESLNLNMQIDFSYDGETLLGTGGAIKKATDLLSESFFVLYGDSYLPVNYATIQSYYIQNSLLSLLTVFKNENKNHKNNVLLHNGLCDYDKSNFLGGYNYIDYGVSIFRKHDFERMPVDTFDLEFVYKTLIYLREIIPLEIKQKFYEVGSIEGIEELKKYLKEQNG